MKNVLVIDDDEKICLAFEQFLADEGYTPSVANNAEEGVRKVQAEKPDIVMLDVVLPGMNGLEALEKIKGLHPDVTVIIMTAHDTVETTIEAMKLQAFDFLPKPIDLDRVKSILDRATTMQAVRDELPVEVSDESAQSQVHRLVGKSPPMRQIYMSIGVMAGNTITVLIEGESGTGKELVAQAIHAHSPRKDKPYIPVNCGALPDELLESELFGYETGAFTGARSGGKPGKFELADGGTLFLDEVSSMSPALQVKLQRALQEQEIQKVGGTKTLKVDVRVIAATNQDLAESVRLGTFRADLYYRFKLLSIHIPPLRERTEDIPLLIDHFLQVISGELGKPIRGVSSEGRELLQRYDWPGNVRELENALRSAAVRCRADVILPEHLPPEIVDYKGRSHSSKSRLEATLESALRGIVQEAIAQNHETLYDEVIDAVESSLTQLILEAFDGNQTKTAKLLGISRTTLLKRLKDWKSRPGAAEETSGQVE